MKVCSECEKERPEYEFSPVLKGDNCGPRRSPCKPCCAARTRVWTKNNRLKVIAYHKNHDRPKEAAIRLKKREVVDKLRDVPCMDCGNKFPALCMDFDHVKGVKLANISEMVHFSKYSIESILTEINKCEVVCANCHRLRTSQNGWGLNHRNKEQQSISSIGVN